MLNELRLYVVMKTSQGREVGAADGGQFDK